MVPVAMGAQNNESIADYGSFSYILFLFLEYKEIKM